MSSVTPYQPVLPAEGDFSDAEINFVDDSPPGLFPENQNSNFGLILRKLFTDKVQDLIGQQTTLYNERFVKTSLDYLDMWEQDYGLPMAPAGRTVAQRRQDVLSRIQVGPFTRSRRAAIVENFIVPTFGAGVLLFPAGVTIGSGIPLYSGATSLAGTYVIRENYLWKNLLPNPSFEVNTTGWNAINSATLARSVTQQKYGVASMLVTCPGSVGDEGASASTAAGLVQPAGSVISASIFDFANANPGGCQAWVRIYNTDATTTDGLRVNFTPGLAWNRVACTATVAAGKTGDRAAIFVTSNLARAQSFYLDGAQVELGAATTDWSDPAGQDFFYEVRILNSVTPDLVGLTRALTRITPAGISFVITSTPSP